MTAVAEKQSPLVAFGSEKQASAEKVGVFFSEIQFQGYYNLRIDPNDSTVCESVREACGFDLPGKANYFVQSENLNIYWLGPDEWLLKIPDEEDISVIDAIRAAPGDSFHALTDNSSGLTHIRVSGEHADTVIRQGTTLDIHPSALPAGSCAQTVFAKTNVIIACRGESEPEFDLLVRRSFADYVMLFLKDAAIDYGYQLTMPVNAPTE